MHTNIMGEKIDQSLVFSAVSPVFVQTRESSFFFLKESEWKLSEKDEMSVVLKHLFNTPVMLTSW